VATAGMFDPNIAPGQVGLVLYSSQMGGRPIGARLNQREPQALGPLEFTFLRERQYAGLQVVYNPGVPIIWLACALIIVGILIVFWLPPRRLWAQVLPGANGGSLVLVRGLAPERAGFGGEFERLAGELRERLEGEPLRADGAPLAPSPTRGGGDG